MPIHDWLVDFYSIAADPSSARIRHGLLGLEQIYDVDHVWLEVASPRASALGEVFASSDQIDSLVRQYSGYYRAIDPRVRVASTLPIGAAFVCHHHLDDAFVKHDEVFQDLLIPNGRRYILGTRLIERPDFRAHFAFNHFVGREPFEGDILSAFDTLTRHLTNWLNLTLQFSRLRGENLILSNIGDGGCDGMAVFDSGKHLVFANAAAMSLLVPERQSGRFALRGDERACLDAELSAVIRTRIGSTARINLRSTEGRRTIELRLAPLPNTPWTGFARNLRIEQSSGHPDASADFRFGDQPAGSILVTFKLFVRADKDTTYLKHRLGLTPAETQIAVQFFRGRSVREIAASRATSLRTLRTQMTSIMAKFGVNSLQDLLRLADTIPDARKG
jgi:DNA-binding CsgD family transcriptional regulator